ncbi:hypothetical protein QZH41_020423 [Actinostola sp. cb2023]|nr:hypothetical protein QZH41_020423 [Actinostola sp. cb2023]
MIHYLKLLQENSRPTISNSFRKTHDPLSQTLSVSCSPPTISNSSRKTDDPLSQTLSRKLIVTKENAPCENLMDYVITSTEREDMDDGFYMMNMERTITIHRKVILEPTQL